MGTGTRGGGKKPGVLSVAVPVCSCLGDELERRQMNTSRSKVLPGRINGAESHVCPRQGCQELRGRAACAVSTAVPQCLAFSYANKHGLPHPPRYLLTYLRPGCQFFN